MRYPLCDVVGQKLNDQCLQRNKTSYASQAPGGLPEFLQVSSAGAYGKKKIKTRNRRFCLMKKSSYHPNVWEAFCPRG